MSYISSPTGAHPTAGVSALSGTAMGQDAHPGLFGPCKAELEQLLEHLKLSPEDANLAYQDIAMRLFDLLNKNYIQGTAAMELLAAPVRTAWEQTKKRRNTNDR